MDRPDQLEYQPYKIGSFMRTPLFFKVSHEPTAHDLTSR